MNKARKTLSAEQWGEILDQLSEAGTLWLLITGGEPLLHPEFEKIYTDAVKKGFIINLFTNAALIKDKYIERFKKYPPFSIEVTLYGNNEQTYQTVTQTKNSYAKVIANCKRLLQEGLPLKLKTVAIKQTIHEVEDIKKFAEEEMGVDFKFDTKIDPTIYGESMDHVRADLAEITALEERVAGREAIALDLQAFKEWSKSTQKSAGTDGSLYTCGAGKNSYYIDYKGWLHTCSTGRLEEEAFDLTQSSFKEIWYKQIPGIIYQSARDKNEVCRTCEYRTMCDACPATAKLATGSKFGRPMYVCQQTMARKERFLDSLQN